jgi:hypothetical protein
LIGKVKLQCSEEVSDGLNRRVGFVIGGFELPVGAVCGIGLVVETTVGQRTAEALVEEEE